MPDNGDRPIEVLLVEDDDEDFLLMRDFVARLPDNGGRHTLSWATDAASALELCAQRHFDVCLIDYRLGTDDGIELVRALIARDHDLPMIVLTGQDEREVDVEATQAGAADFLVKGEITPTLLERTLRYAIRSHNDMRALRASTEKLRQAQRMEAVGQLAGGIAHDFNNLMTAVIGFSELALARLEPDDVVRRYLGEIKRAGERAGAMTHQLLAFSRKQVLDTRVVDLNAVVSEVEHLLRRLITDDIELTCSLAPALGAVEADPGQLEQVLMNLTINARDAMPDGGKLTIETSNVELDAADASRHIDVEQGPYVALAVTDTGVGMTADTIGRIFEPFYTTKEVGKGTGLGLSTVFGIVKQTGGDVGVYSEPGHGATFRIYLPRVEAPLDRLEPHASVVEPPRGNETVLLVDDEHVVRSFEREVLLDSGYTVLEAASAQEALELLGGHGDELHLLITDVVMPGMSGPELAKRLGCDHPGLRTLFTSGYAADAIVRHGVLEPDSAFLPKPLSRGALTSKVRTLLDTPPRAESSAAGRAADGSPAQPAAG